MSYRVHAYRLAVLGICALSLMGCDTIKKAAGMQKEGPDEFAVVTKQPLIIPPEYNLRPPRDGAPPTNQVLPTDSAQAALFDNDPAAAAKAMPGDASQAEKILLVRAGALNADPTIRQHVASDGRNMEAADDSFTQQVLFWKDDAPRGENVNADAEDKRLQAQKAAGGATAAPKPPKDSATIKEDKDSDEEESHGWFDWIF
jgi:Protein of unknown function (DUF3035)